MTRESGPDYLLFAQHGWADTGKDIGRLASAIANPQTLVISPSLGLIKTFIRIKPLISQLENIVFAKIRAHPDVPLKIIGHSMGGLIWLELLNRHPQWWKKVHSFVLLGSPIGGSNIARLIDPFGIGIGTARDLGQNRRELAEKIAQQIPTLSISSDMGMGSDGLVTVENTKFNYANWLLLSGIHHHFMKCHPDMILPIQKFWQNPQLGLPPEPNFANQFIRRLRSVSGMTDTDYRNFKRSSILANFPDEITLHTWKNSIGINHIYLSKDEKHCLYAGYVGIMHNFSLRQAIKEIMHYAC